MNLIRKVARKFQVYLRTIFSIPKEKKHNIISVKPYCAREKMSRNLRILHIIEYFYPQLGYQETFLPKAETKCGHKVYVLTSNLFDKAIFEANEKILKTRKKSPGKSVERGIETIRLPAIHLPIVNKLYLLGLEAAITKLRPDVIVCHGIVFLTSIRVAKLKTKLPAVKLIFDDHMTFNATRGGLFRYMYTLFRLMFTPRILRSADAIVAATYETRRFMEEIYGIPRDKIKIIPLGVETTLFRRDPVARKTIRSICGIDNNDIVFIYAGKIVPEKGVHLLVEAALNMVDKFHNVKIMIVGGGKQKYKNLLSERTDSSGSRDRFIFVPNIANQELYKYYSAADVGVWPLQCSMTMLEAMSTGLPVIISDNSGALERISEGNGLQYKEGDTNDLAEKMKMMLDSNVRKKMGLRARRFAEKNDWKIISEHFLKLMNC